MLHTKVFCGFFVTAADDGREPLIVLYEHAYVLYATLFQPCQLPYLVRCILRRLGILNYIALSSRWRASGRTTRLRLHAWNLSNLSSKCCEWHCLTPFRHQQLWPQWIREQNFTVQHVVIYLCIVDSEVGQAELYIKVCAIIIDDSDGSVRLFCTMPCKCSNAQRLWQDWPLLARGIAVTCSYDRMFSSCEAERDMTSLFRCWQNGCCT